MITFRRTAIIAAVVLVSLLPAAQVTLAQAPGGGGSGLDERVAALKQSLAQSAQNLRTYQWVETTTVTMKGEVKSQKQMSCYYGADGGLQKIPIAATPPPKKKGGLRGAIQKSKTEELQGKMKQAVELVHMYVPPDPALIQRSKDAGKVSLEILKPGKLVRIVFRDYRLPGDALALTIDLTSNRLTALDVSTYLGQPSSPVTLNGRFATLNDGTTYPANQTLGLQEEKLSVTVANSGYRHMN
jgi:hypothetical protein